MVQVVQVKIRLVNKYYILILKPRKFKIYIRMSDFACATCATTFKEENMERDLSKKPKNSNALFMPPDLPDGENNKYTAFALAVMQLPKIDVKNPDELATRLTDYFKICAEHDMKPAVAGMALAMGIDRRRLWEMKTDVAGRNVDMPQECREIIKMAYNSLEVLWEGYMTSGKINPVSGIFLAKNNFGYQDKQEYVVTPNTMADEIDPRVIEAKYDELPE